jgi:hypothetical protein
MESLEDEEIGLRVGLLGELEVEKCLVQNHWHPVRLDTAQMASNADLIAVNRKRRVAIQVKSSNNSDRHDWLGFGYATGFLKDGTSIFNSKKSPLIADVVVAVSYNERGSRFVVLPVALAEALCRLHATYWNGIPKKQKGKRSTSFPIYLPLNANRKPHATHYDRLKRNVAPYENAWQILKEPVDKLHDPKKWPLLK